MKITALAKSFLCQGLTIIMNYHYINTCQWLIRYKNEALVNAWTCQYLKAAMGMENGIKIIELLFCDMYC